MCILLAVDYATHEDHLKQPKTPPIDALNKEFGLCYSLTSIDL